MSAGKVISVFGSAILAPGSPEYQRALRLGQLLAQEGWTVVTGGYGGGMEAVCRGAREAGGHTVGVTLPVWGLTPNPWVCEERPQASYVDRQALVTTEADGYVALDGGVGTLGELSLVWALLRTHLLPARPLVTLGERWRRLLKAFAAELVVAPEDLCLVTPVDTPEEAVAILRRALAGGGSRP